MKNVADTQAYNAFDHIFLKALRSISHIVSVNRLTQPFWGRWRASNIGDDVLTDFLSSIRDLDDWPDAAQRMADTEMKRLELIRDTLPRDEKVRHLRRMSYLFNLGQWGILPIGERKQSIYTLAKRYYIEAETLAFGERFIRFHVHWDGKSFPANLHLPDAHMGELRPLIIVVHGLDDCKEEHLATELALLDSGCAVIGFDGPGQGEAFLLDGHLWTDNFAVSFQH